MYFRFPIVLIFIFICSVGLLILQGKLGRHPYEANGQTGELPEITNQTTNIPDAINSIRTVDLRAHLEFLADDLLEGRDAGSRGARIAANYIATHFERFGLKPVGDNGSFFQTVGLSKKQVLDSSQFKIEINGEMVPLEFGRDYILTHIPGQPGEKLVFECVFAGFGIRAEEYDYDDYRDLEVNDKAVFYVSGEPKSDDETFFDGDRQTRYASSRAKGRVALQAGAGAAIGVMSVKDLERLPWTRLQGHFSKSKTTLASDETRSGSLSLLISPDAAEMLFADEVLSYNEVMQQVNDGTLKPFLMKKKIEISVEFRDVGFDDNNVVGYLQGSDPVLKSEVIVFSAHYDHVGIGKPVAGDSIYNGAADNASGVSGLLELAEAMTSFPSSSRRSMLFLAVTAEEKGLLGSRYYVEHPIYPLEKTVANFNMDMIGIGDSTAIVVYGIERSTLGEDIRWAAEKIGLKIYPDELPEQRIFYRSDHYNFALKGVPAIFPSFGILKKNMADFDKFYHRPSDDKNLFWLNYNYMKRHVQVVYEAALRVANANTPPAWYPGDKFAKVRKK